MAKTSTISFRVTDDERKLLEKWSAVESLKPSDFSKKRALDRAELCENLMQEKKVSFILYLIKEEFYRIISLIKHAENERRK